MIANIKSLGFPRVKTVTSSSRNRVIVRNNVSKVTTATKPTEKTFALGFTKTNELFVGRLAMLGVASSLVGEIITGKGAIAQFAGEIGATTTEVQVAVWALALVNLVAGVLPTSQTFVPDEVEKRNNTPTGPLQDPKISLLEPQKFFGISESFGFSKENELFVGRVAQLGFAAELIGEMSTGKGPLAQLNMETGIPIMDAEVGILALIAFMLFASINPGSGKFVDDE
jgi:photosystem II 22kDa protein